MPAGTLRSICMGFTIEGNDHLQFISDTRPLFASPPSQSNIMFHFFSCRHCPSFILPLYLSLTLPHTLHNGLCLFTIPGCLCVYLLGVLSLSQASQRENKNTCEEMSVRIGYPVVHSPSLPINFIIRVCVCVCLCLCVGASPLANTTGLCVMCVNPMCSRKPNQ